MSLSVESFVDGYPADAAEYEVQRRIDSELRTCHALRGRGALPGALYPGYFAAGHEAARQWLTPALRRFAWLAGAEPWSGYLRGLIRLTLPSQWESPVDAEALLLLAQLGERLQTNSGMGDCEHLNQAVSTSLRALATPWPEELVRALRQLLVHLVRVHCHQSATFDVGWQLWRNRSVPDDGVFCLSSVARSVDWGALWDLRAADADPHMPPSPQQMKKLRTAVVKRIGVDAFARQVQEWFETLASAGQPVVMTAACREVLILLLQACQAEPELAIDQALFALCGVRWRGHEGARLEKEWLGDLLKVIVMRPAAQAFACAERLSINPDTKRFFEVFDVYNHLLSELTESAAGSRALQGVDGYDLKSEPALHEMQVVLDRYLRAYQPRERADSGPDEHVWAGECLLPQLAMRRLSVDRPASLRAITLRTKWLAKAQTGEAAEVWLCALSCLREQVLKLKAAPQGLAQLIELIDGAAASPAPQSELVFEAVQAHVKASGYSPPLVGALQRWRDALKSPRGHALRRQIGWMLWFDDSGPVEPSECWSASVRQDLRAMPAASRAAWVALLQTASFGVSAKPTVKWLKAAPQVLAKVGAKPFRKLVCNWFAPFRDGKPLHLTVAGRDVFRTLISYALVAEDPQVDEAIGWFLTANWRSKKDRACAAIVVPTVVYVMSQRSDELAHQAVERSTLPLDAKSHRLYVEVCGRLGRTPTLAPPADPSVPDAETIQRQVRQQMLGYLAGPNMVVKGDQLLVTGVRNQYSVNIGDGRIVRVEDGALLQVDQGAAAGIGVFRAMTAMLTLANPMMQPYYRVKLCAKVLERDDLYAHLILDADAV